MAKQIKGYIRCLKCFHKFLRETAADKYCSDACREAAISARRHEDSIARVNRAKAIRQPGCLFAYLETECVEHLAIGFNMMRFTAHCVCIHDLPVNLVEKIANVLRKN